MTNNADDDDVDLASLLISGGPGGKLNLFSKFEDKMKQSNAI